MSTTVRYAHAGGPLDVSAVVRAPRRRGAKAAARRRATFYLSRDRRRSKGDVRLGGSARVPRLRPGRRAAVAATARVPARAAAGTYHVLACAPRARCAGSRRTVRVTATVTSSGTLIGAALESRRIDANTATVYRVLAAFGDPRLPARYRGDDGLLAGDIATRDAAASWTTLSAHQRALIGPYLQPPPSSRGWRAPARQRRSPVRRRRGPRANAAGATAAKACRHRTQPDMDYVSSLGGRIRVWYPRGTDHIAVKDAKQAPRIAAEAAAIWTKYKALLGREPRSDAAFCGINGGNGAYDIYLMRALPMSWRKAAATVSYKGYGGTATPAFTAFATWGSGDVIRWALAHELFHAFQFSYRYAAAPVAQYDGFDEGAATWAANDVYPHDDYEHDHGLLVRWDGESLISYDWGYDDWAFDLFLTEVYGRKTIPAIYAKFQKLAPYAAVNAAIRGGFAQRWPEFTRVAWNQEPVKTSFRAWDHWNQVPEASGSREPLRPTDLRLAGQHQRTFNVPFRLTPLTRKYYSLHVDDDHIRELRLHNTASGLPGASIQAFVQLEDGTWHTEDWTSRKTVNLCRDRPDQNVSNIVLMYANAGFQRQVDRAGNVAALAPSTQATLDLRDSCGYDLVYTHSSRADVSFPYGPIGYDEQSGVYGYHQDVALAATAPLTLDDARTTGTGAGALTWQRASWSDDDNSRSRSGQAHEVWCTLDMKSAVSATQPGTATVRSIKFGPAAADGGATIASLDLALTGAAENWHTTETGDCAIGPQDNHRTRFMDLLLNAYPHTTANGLLSRYLAPTGGGTDHGVELTITGGWKADADGNPTRTVTFDIPVPGYSDFTPPGAVIHWTDTFTLRPSQSR